MKIFSPSPGLAPLPVVVGVFFSKLALLLRRYIRHIRAILIFLVVVLALDLYLTISISTPSTRTELLANGGAELSQAYQQRVYIAALHWNGEELLRKHWIPALLDLVKHWKPENIYVSISESGSWDGAKDALKDLDYELERLGIERTIQMSNHTHADELGAQKGEDDAGWIMGTKGKVELRRLPFLAAERNKAMTPLKELAYRTEKQPRLFDRVLWLNDVIFDTDSVAALINTHKGDYAAACSIDFQDPPNSHRFYDTFAVRDDAGNPPLTWLWPWFSDDVSRKAVMSFSPVPVKSCWNGMVAFNAGPFYNDPPLQFRAIPDTLASLHVEGSECCLIHIDNPIAPDKGIWMNPNVRVAYNEPADKVVNSVENIWPSTFAKIQGIWVNRWAYWTGWPWRRAEQRLLDSRFAEWKRGPLKAGEAKRHEDGRICLVDEMQILVENGWTRI